MREEHGGAMQKPGAAASYSPPRSQVLSELVAVALALRTATSLFDYLLAGSARAPLGGIRQHEHVETGEQH